MKLKISKKPKLFQSKSIKEKEKIKNILMAITVIFAVSFTFLYLFNKNFHQENLISNILGGAFNGEENQEQEIELEYHLSTDEREEIYIEKANQGDGLTHVARRALEKHLQKQEKDYTAEQKIFMEDYIQKKLGGEPLSLNQEVSISQDLISESIEKAELLSQEQINNLKQYSILTLPL